MPLLLSTLACLLSHLESTTDRTRANHAVSQWLTTYRADLAASPRTLLAVYSVLLPHLRCDRVYGLREDALARVLSKLMCLGPGRAKQLHDWRSAGSGRDFAAVVEGVMRQTETSGGGEVSVEELDDMLDRLAGRCRFSSEDLRKGVRRGEGVEEVLSGAWHRLASWEGKWVVRVVLRNLGAVEVEETPALDAYHFLLPHLLAVKSSLQSACLAVCEQSVVRDFPPHPSPDKREQYITAATAAGLLSPEVGVKVGRGEFVKGTSTKHAVRLARGRRMVVERKYDGEYCQVHFDVTKGEKGITLFSKSGRDSTEDRRGIHRALIEAFQLTSPDSRKIHKNCILEGELVVYNSRERKIMPFHHLRRHIPRSGVFIGTYHSSPRDPDSHLMILLFDILLLDSRSLLSAPLRERMQILSRILVSPLSGHCELVQCTGLDLSDSPAAHQKLRRLFARAIIKKWEGLVLKPYDAPYIDLSRPPCTNANGNGFYGSVDTAWIKLKKDYIPGLGDAADFCVVAAKADMDRAERMRQKPGTLNTFYAAVVRNKDDVRRLGVRPLLEVLFEVTYSITKQDLEWVQRLVYCTVVPYSPGMGLEEYDLSFHKDLKISPPPTHVFTTPLIFEIVGGGFVRPSNCGFFIPRHPRVVKIHWDRDIPDAVGFEELQKMAEDAKRGEEDVESQLERLWIARLERGDAGAQLAESQRSRTDEETPKKGKKRKVEGGGDEEMVWTPLKERKELDTLVGVPEGKVARRLTFPGEKQAEEIGIRRVGGEDGSMGASLPVENGPSGTAVSISGPVPSTQPPRESLPGSSSTGSGSSTSSKPASTSSRRWNGPLASISNNIHRRTASASQISTRTCSIKSPTLRPPSHLPLPSPPITKSTKSSCPITHNTIYLLPFLSRFPSLFEKLSGLDAAAIHVLQLPDHDGCNKKFGFGHATVVGYGDTNQRGPEKKKKIFLVDPQLRRSDTRRVLQLLREQKEKRRRCKRRTGEGEGEKEDEDGAWEVYDWRVCFAGTVEAGTADTPADAAAMSGVGKKRKRGCDGEVDTSHGNGDDREGAEVDWGLYKLCDM